MSGWRFWERWLVVWEDGTVYSGHILHRMAVHSKWGINATAISMGSPLRTRIVRKTDHP